MSNTREKWLAERRNLIGASESASILGYGYADQGPQQIWAKKLGIDTEERDEAKLWIGNMIQPALANIASRVIGIDVECEPDNVVRTNPEFPFLGASLDAVANDYKGEFAPVELKNVDKSNRSEWLEGAPLKFQVQCQQQMLVTGAKTSILFGLIGGNEPIWHEVVRNDRFIAVMVEKLREFWQYVESRTMPPSVDPFETARVLSLLHPNDNGLAVALPDYACRLISEREEAMESAKQIEHERCKIDNQLKHLLGENTYGLLPDGRCVSWKTQTRGAHYVEESTFRVLRVAKKAPKDCPAPITSQIENHQPALEHQA